ncbi:MAG: acetoacetyl-CoA reductase [Betaproteobacteria bacterium]|nr:acetoacetyl-CoA reductase [Betaproteobacteria bacterium]
MTDRKVALITGGVGGIGTGVTRKLAEDGFFVVANYAIEGSEVAWRAAMSAAGMGKDRVALAHGDVTDFDAMDKMVADITDDHGPVAVLVNCAGITRDMSFRKMSPDQWQAVISTNLTSVFNVTRHVIDGMCERGWGRIVNISSVNALKGQFGQTNYTAAKAGILGFTRSLALEVAAKGVTVNAISPGFIDTDMTRAIRDDVREQLVASIPAARVGVPDDIAQAVAYLVSDGASYMTGANLAVNGGTYMHA